MKLKFFIILALIAGVFLLLKRESTTKQMATQSLQAEEVAKTDKAIDDAVRFVANEQPAPVVQEVTGRIVVTDAGGTVREIPATNRTQVPQFRSEAEVQAMIQNAKNKQ